MTVIITHNLNLIFLRFFFACMTVDGACNFVVCFTAGLFVPAIHLQCCSPIHIYSPNIISESWSQKAIATFPFSTLYNQIYPLSQSNSAWPWAILEFAKKKIVFFCYEFEEAGWDSCEINAARSEMSLFIYQLVRENNEAKKSTFASTTRLLVRQHAILLDVQSSAPDGQVVCDSEGMK